MVPPCPGGIGRLGPWLAVGGVQQGTLGCPRAGRLLWPPPPPRLCTGAALIKTAKSWGVQRASFSPAPALGLRTPFLAGDAWIPLQ